MCGRSDVLFTSVLGQMPKKVSFTFLFYGLLLELILLGYNLIF